jgi:hypothetical protein
MAEWDRSMVHCLVTWITLVDLGQTRRGFESAGKLKMKRMQFWDPHASADVRRMRAKTVAIQADNLFRRYWGAQYEEGVTRTKAINAAVRTLVKEDATVADLAACNNEHYLFYGEER